MFENLTFSIFLSVIITFVLIGIIHEMQKQLFFLCIWYSFLFIGFVQVSLGTAPTAIIGLTVYFGAIAVLFLFIIMVLNFKRRVKMSINFEKKLTIIFSIGLAILLFSSLFESGQALIVKLFFPSKNELGINGSITLESLICASFSYGLGFTLFRFFYGFKHLFHNYKAKKQFKLKRIILVFVLLGICYGATEDLNCTGSSDLNTEQKKVLVLQALLNKWDVADGWLEKKPHPIANYLPSFLTKYVNYAFSFVDAYRKVNTTFNVISDDGRVENITLKSLGLNMQYGRYTLGSNLVVIDNGTQERFVIEGNGYDYLSRNRDAVFCNIEVPHRVPIFLNEEAIGHRGQSGGHNPSFESYFKPPVSSTSFFGYENTSEFKKRFPDPIDVKGKRHYAYKGMKSHYRI